MLDILSLPDGHDNLSQQGSILKDCRFAILDVLCIERRDGLFLFSAGLHELDQAVFLFILRIQLFIHRCHAFSRCHNGRLIGSCPESSLSLYLSLGQLGFQLRPDAVEAFCIRRGQLVLDLNRFPCIHQLLQADLVLIGELSGLSAFEQLGDFLVQAVQGLDVPLHPF
ncbi:hypothetical protein SDC9_195557 [bioreactor metagenome]|uniref:Uncharacterized protein n=1 Tax=bioreactor metagenome TaxID=1076179 RepID=A0A645IKV3_9ZZZZ